MILLHFVAIPIHLGSLFDTDIAWANQDEPTKQANTRDGSNIMHDNNSCKKYQEKIRVPRNPPASIPESVANICYLVQIVWFVPSVFVYKIAATHNTAHLLL